MPNDSIQGMKLWEKSDTACRITKQRHDIWVKITNNMSEPLYKACDTCKKTPNHVRSLCTGHENREKSLAACYSQVNLYVFNITSLQLIQFQTPLLFSESEPEAITPSHTARCLPLTGSEENATMLNPTVRENLLFPSSPPSAKLTRRFPQAQSMVADAANYLPIS